jgi:hypothetical protein
MLRILSAALIVCALAAPACAFSADEVRALLSASSNAPVTIDRRFNEQEVLALVNAGRARVTVVCAGFSADQPRRFLSMGGRIVVDSTVPATELLQLAAIGRGRVVVSPGGVNAQVLAQMKAYGCPTLATNGGSTFEEKMRSLRNGEQAVADSAMSVREIQQLIAVGGARMHVFAKGFSPTEANNFVRSGAIVWVDSSLPTPVVLALARAGNKRVIVRTSGFAFDALKSFAAAGAHVVFAFDAAKRETARSANFDQLHGNL